MGQLPHGDRLGSCAEKLEIELIEIGSDFLKAKMPVQGNTQPYGILNGGASCVLAETLGSIAGNLCLEQDSVAMGMSLTANHLRPVSQGFVWACARPRHLGRSSQVWEIEVVNEEDKPVCLSVLTLAVRPR